MELSLSITRYVLHWLEEKQCVPYRVCMGGGSHGLVDVFASQAPTLHPRLAWISDRPVWPPALCLQT